MEKRTYSRSTLFKLLVAMVVLAVVTTSLLSSTLSKYITTVQGEGTVTGAMFNFNNNGTTHEWIYPFLGATPDSSDIGGDETLDGGQMLAPGQSGAFTLGIYFAATVDSTMNAAQTRLEGTGAFADLAALDAVALRFIVSMEPIANPDFNSAAAVVTSEFEETLENAITNSIGAGGYYQATDPVTVIDETIYVYWEWLENVDDEADTALGLEIYNASVGGGDPLNSATWDIAASQLTLYARATAEQVELDGVEYELITTPEELRAALEQEKTSIRFGADVEYPDPVDSTFLRNVDLDGYTLTCAGFRLVSDDTGLISIRDGTIVTTAAISGTEYSIYVSAPNGSVTYVDVINYVFAGTSAYVDGTINTVRLLGYTRFIFVDGENELPAVLDIPSNTRVFIADTVDTPIELNVIGSNVIIENYSRVPGSTITVDESVTFGTVDIVNNGDITVDNNSATVVVDITGGGDTESEGLISFDGMPKDIWAADTEWLASQSGETYTINNEAEFAAFEASLAENDYEGITVTIGPDTLDMKNYRLDIAEGAFRGTLDGRGCVIKNLFVDDQNIALVSRLYGTIKNLTLLDSTYDVSGVGGWFGLITNNGEKGSVIENVNITNPSVDIEGREGAWPFYAAGMVGSLRGTTITDCSVSGGHISLNGYHAAAGGIVGDVNLVGDSLTSLISRCSVSDIAITTQAVDNNGSCVGGILANFQCRSESTVRIEYSSVDNCSFSSFCPVQPKISALAVCNGYNGTTLEIYDCYAGNVETALSPGGLYGSHCLLNMGKLYIYDSAITEEHEIDAQGWIKIGGKTAVFNFPQAVNERPAITYLRPLSETPDP